MLVCWQSSMLSPVYGTNTTRNEYRNGDTAQFVRPTSITQSSTPDVEYATPLTHGGYTTIDAGLTQALAQALVRMAWRTNFRIECSPVVHLNKCSNPMHMFARAVPIFYKQLLRCANATVNHSGF